MSAGGGGPYPSFQTNVNRTKTKRWVEAKSFSYDGDDWGDDDVDEGDVEPEPRPPPSSIHSGPAGRPHAPYGPPPGPQSNPNIGPPTHTYPRGRPSFDGNRPFSPHQGGFEGPYPTAQRSPFPTPGHYRQSPSQDRAMRPRGASQSRPMDFNPHPHAPFMPDTRGRGPYPIRPNERRSESGNRPSPGEMYGRQSPARQSPVPSSSRNSRDSSPGHRFPPRKSSLSQKQAPFESSTLDAPKDAALDDSNEESSAKPLPFVRPADIYKRIEEEKQRRASQESSRPSTDLERIRSTSPPPPLPHSDRSDSNERAPRAKPTLDPVTERKSEYGFDKMLEDAPEDHPSTEPEPSSAISQTYASSQYSDRDPISASTVHSKQSFTPGRPDAVRLPGPREAIEEDQPTPRGVGPQEANPNAQNRTDLKHTQSLGYRSLVEKAFEDSEDQVPPTPQSMGDSVPRSNSASTSQISPIISRNSSAVGQNSSLTGPTEAPPTIPEEPNSRPSSSGTQMNANKVEEPLTPPVRPGYRREASTPSSNNSPARRPVSVETGEIPHSELATLSTAAPMNNQEQLQEGLSQPRIPRSESPTKGKVRDLAGKFNVSTQSSRSNSPQKESPRPVTARNESFRPVLPGGWMSYTTNNDSTQAFETPALREDSRVVDTSFHPNKRSESPPTAVAPKKRQNDGLSGSAFAAAAAAGSALAGAFTTAAGQPSTVEEKQTERMQPRSQQSSDLQAPRYAATGPTSVASSKPPTPPPKDAEESTSTMRDYFPTPLSPRKSSDNESTPTRPQMLSALSTDTSPQDSENDRLRKEILKDLTPRTAKVDPKNEFQSDLMATPKPRDQVESTLIPEEYNTYWNDMGQSPDLSLSKPGTNESQARSESKDLPLPKEQAKPKSVKRRFSWETWSDDEEVPAVQPLSTPNKDVQREVPQNLEGPRPDGGDEALYSPEHTESQRDDDTQPELPSIPIQDVPDHGSSPEATHLEPEPLYARPVDDDQTAIRSPSSQSPHPLPKQPPDVPRISQESASSKAMGFKTIMSLKSPHERISAFNNVRQQLMQTDSGLAGWLQATSDKYPEHGDIINKNGRVENPQAPYQGHKPSPSRSKFPRIASLGGAVPSSQDKQESGHPKRDVSDSYGSMLSSHQMQEEGKKLLHSAGKIGGKAGGAAKGLLMKGKNRLRQSGGGEKARSRSRQYSESRDVPHSSTSATHVNNNGPQVTQLEKSRQQKPEPNTYERQQNVPSGLSGPTNHSFATGQVKAIASRQNDSEESNAKQPDDNTHIDRARGFEHPNNLPTQGFDDQNVPERLSHGVVPNAKGHSGSTIRNPSIDALESRIDSTNDYNQEPQHGHDEIRDSSTVPTISGVAERSEDAIHYSSAAREVRYDASSRQSNLLSPKSLPQAPKSPAISVMSRDVASPSPTHSTHRSVSPPASLRSASREPSNLPRSEQVNEPISKTNTAPSYVPVPEAPIAEPGHHLREEASENPPSHVAPESQQRRASIISSISNRQSNDYSSLYVGPSGEATLAQKVDPSETSQHPVHRETSQYEPPLPDRRQRQSYSRPFKEPDTTDHPAFRHSPDDIQRRSQVYATEEMVDDQIDQSRFQQQDDSVYRIPGPYGQQYRSPRQSRPPQQYHTDRDQRDMQSDFRQSIPYDYNSDNHVRPPSQERPLIPRPDATEYSLPGIGPPSPPPPSPPKSRPRSGIFGRARSRSRPPVINDDASDTVENLFREEMVKKERRSSLFGRRTSKQTIPESQPVRNTQQALPNSSAENNNKKLKKLQRASTSETSPKRGFARLSGIFSRSRSTNQSPTPKRNTMPAISTPPPHDSVDPGYGGIVQSPTAVSGSGTAPKKYGYYAVYSDNREPARNGEPRSRNRSVSNENRGRFDIDNYRSPPPSLPPNLRIDTTSSKHRPIQPSSALTQRHNAPIRSSPYETSSPTATSPYGYGTARGLNSSSLSHAIDLHKRSRSPRGGRRNSEEDDLSTDPAYRLGRFDSPKERKEGDQEQPWKIGLPDDRRNDHHQRPPRNSSLAASQQHSGRSQRQVQLAELQGSRVNGDESEEEIVMSSTAYPGQEWIPQSMGHD